MAHPQLAVEDRLERTVEDRLERVMVQCTENGYLVGEWFTMMDGRNGRQWSFETMVSLVNWIITNLHHPDVPSSIEFATDRDVNDPHGVTRLSTFIQ